MTSTAIRTVLHQYLDSLDDINLQEIFQLITKGNENVWVTYTEELKQELDRRTYNYESGINKAISAEESKQRIKNILITVGKEKAISDFWQDNTFVAEMERRVAGLENDTEKGFSWEEVKNITRKSLSELAAHEK